MERLREAIDKARAAREGALGQGAAPPAEDRPNSARAASVMPAGPAAEEARIRAAWSDIESFDPPRAHLERNRIASAATGRSGNSEAIGFDRLRTRILQEMRAKNWKRLAITSPGPRCGKSTLTLNLAFSMARRETERTVICEADLRRPSLASLIGLPHRKDFAKVLQGIDPFREHAVRIGGNLAIGTIRQARPRSAELLQSVSATMALDAIEAEYDPTIMLFDTAPVLVSDDTVGLIGRVDCVLIVAAAGATTIAEIDACEREVAAQSEVLGIVLNKCRHLDRGTGYDSYYA